MYKSYLKGAHVGEIELILGTNRLETLTCVGVCEFMAITKANFLDLLT